MKVDKIIELLATVMWQYLSKRPKDNDFFEDDDSEWFEGTRKEYEEYLLKNHLTEEDVQLIELVEEEDLSFD